MNCYFCNQITSSYIKNGSGGEGCNFYCQSCDNKYITSDNSTRISNVITSTDFYNNLLYAHIYYDKYHIRLHLQENCTFIISAGYKPIIELSGFPINPQNVSKKLKTILVFQ